ncbi:MAG: hypothetical protein JXB34_06345 [Bacteroidales bacterium]|nr:hypothetical protein [Bacteroidales bacterium]
MRIWSVHPCYLDTKGLVALWRETLLAKNVLEGNTKGYKNHPQLERFKSVQKPVEAINQYLTDVYYEALKRGYSFDKEKINYKFSPVKMNVTTGQLRFEREHLLKKLQTRDTEKYSKLISLKELLPHPMFTATEGNIEEWERF